MSSLTNYAEGVLGDVMRGVNPSGLGTWYMALFTTLPGEDGTGGVEVTTQVRVAGRPSFTLADDTVTPGLFENAADVSFGISANTVNNVVGYGYFDAASAGNLWVRKTFTSPVTIAAGSNVRFPA